MRKWMLKALLQGMLSALPKGEKLNYLFQKYVTKSTVYTPNRLERRLTWCARHLENYRQFAQDSALPKTVLELGTGWFPTVPIALYLCGVEKIYTVDIVPLINRETINSTLYAFKNFVHENELKDTLPIVDPNRVQYLLTLADNTARLSVKDILNELNITYVIGDARNLPLPSGSSIGFFISNTTLEHIELGILKSIFFDFYRVAEQGALMSHLIDMSDHYSHFDTGISAINYLQFSDKRWRIYNNSLQYQNRLRMSEYRSVHSAAGFEILSEDRKFVQESTLKEIKLAAQFKDLSDEDLRVKSAWIVSRKVPERAL